MVAPFHALLSIDAEGYSKNPDIVLPTLRTTLLQVTEQALARSGLIETWRSLSVNQSTGDGFLAILPRDTIPALICPFADHLQWALAEAAPQLRGLELALRLRVALHCGLVDDEDPVTAPVSVATTEVSRLLDSEPVKAALRDSDPVVTLVAMIVSAEVFDKFVRGGHTRLRPSQFSPVRAQVKQFNQPVYLYVPTPSALVAPPDDGLADAGSTTGPVPDPAGGISVRGVTVKGGTSQNVIGNRVNGSINQNLP
jgi:hypothetical protein